MAGARFEAVATVGLEPVVVRAEAVELVIARIRPIAADAVTCSGSVIPAGPGARPAENRDAEPS
jgi:hypothetical protein